jgi:hypothetical protein
MDLEETVVRNDCVGEGQQFNRPIEDCQSEFGVGGSVVNFHC